MSAYVIFDVEIRDPARGGAHKVDEGDPAPRRFVLLEFFSVAAWEAFYQGPTYQGLKHSPYGALLDFRARVRPVKVGPYPSADTTVFL